MREIAVSNYLERFVAAIEKFAEAEAAKAETAMNTRLDMKGLMGMVDDLVEFTKGQMPSSGTKANVVVLPPEPLVATETVINPTETVGNPAEPVGNTTETVDNQPASAGSTYVEATPPASEAPGGTPS